MGGNASRWACLGCVLRHISACGMCDGHPIIYRIRHGRRFVLDLPSIHMPENKWKIRVLFICMGNICRSPSAEGVFRRLLMEHGLEQVIEVDSAGTHSYHVGSAPDRRAQRAALDQGVELGHLRARQVGQHDFQLFDYILAMDYDNLEDLRSQCPAEHRHKLRLFLDFSRDGGKDEVPDPYYGGHDGFSLVLRLVRDASEGLLEHLREEITLTH